MLAPRYSMNSVSRHSKYPQSERTQIKSAVPPLAALLAGVVPAVRAVALGARKLPTMAAAQYRQRWIFRQPRPARRQQQQHIGSASPRQKRCQRRPRGRAVPRAPPRYVNQAGGAGLAHGRIRHSPSRSPGALLQQWGWAARLVRPPREKAGPANARGSRCCVPWRPCTRTCCSCCDSPAGFRCRRCTGDAICSWRVVSGGVPDARRKGAAARIVFL